MSASKPHIALFGTSADPPTIGHQGILRWLGEHYDQVAVWASDNPFKEHGATLSQRSAMLRLLTEDLGCENVAVDERLSDRRSLNTLKKAQEIWGENITFSLVIGSDLITQIPRWYRVKDLLPQVTLLIFPRKGYPLQPEALQQIEALQGTWQAATYVPPAVSSSEYRSEGKATMLIPSIIHYIQNQGLYQENCGE
ncbi:nicotinate (nicotinamide) nucleotide adenylyltransferase [[Synechococcus] sp. NIES-970]|nr:nicotinate (nicotinamide) nucleotide adenylyltransferase [[Synechococcus] sp. NIES-970]